MLPSVLHYSILFRPGFLSSVFTGLTQHIAAYPIASPDMIGISIPTTSAVWLLLYDIPRAYTLLLCYV